MRRESASGTLFLFLLPGLRLDFLFSGAFALVLCLDVDTVVLELDPRELGEVTLDRLEWVRGVVDNKPP